MHSFLKNRNAVSVVASSVLSALLIVTAAQAATTISTNIATAGNITTSAGAITADTGDITATAGNIVATAGNVTAGGNLSVTGTTALTGALTANGNVNLGNASSSDLIKVFGALRTRNPGDASNWIDVDTTTFDSDRGWMNNYWVKVWDGAATTWSAPTFTAFQTDAGVKASDSAAQAIWGSEGKTTVFADTADVVADQSTAIGVVGKVVAKSTGSYNATLGTGVGVASLLDFPSAGDTVTSFTNYLAGITGATSGVTLTGATILGVAASPAQSWTNGIDLDNATFTGAEVVLSNGVKIYSGAAETRAAVHSAFGSAPIGSLYLGNTAGATTKPNMFIKTATDHWERIVTADTD